jgi:hypothetical protein
MIKQFQKTVLQYTYCEVSKLRKNVLNCGGGKKATALAL